MVTNKGKLSIFVAELHSTFIDIYICKVWSPTPLGHGSRPLSVENMRNESQFYKKARILIRLHLMCIGTYIVRQL